MNGWLARVLDALGEPALPSALPGPGDRSEDMLASGQALCVFYGPTAAASFASGLVPAAPHVAPEPWTGPSELARPYELRTAEMPEPKPPQAHIRRVMPVTGRPRAPARVVGKLVHLGLRLWRFPGDSSLDAFLEAGAREAGLADAFELKNAVTRARHLLRRLQESEHFAVLDAARQRHHEVPYALEEEGGMTGRVDLICRLPEGRWWLVDFKIDALHTEAQLATRKGHHENQLQRYGRALQRLVGETPRLTLCFLDFCGHVRLEEVQLQCPV